MIRGMTIHGFAAVVSGVIAYVLVDNMVGILTGRSRWEAYWDGVASCCWGIKQQFQHHRTAARKLGMSRAQSVPVAAWRCRRDSVELTLCVLPPTMFPVFLFGSLVVVPLILWSLERKQRGMCPHV